MNWADDPDRRAKADVPDEIVFQTKPQIALDQLRAAHAAGIAAEMVLADAGYANDTDFRDGIAEVGLAYAVGINPSTTLWPPGMAPLPPKEWSGRGRPPSAIRRDGAHQPVSAKQLALDLPKKAWRRLTWREGTKAALTSRFAAVRVRPAHRDYHRAVPRPEEWCMIEWPEREPEPAKYFLSTLPATISRCALVAATKLRWQSSGTTRTSVLANMRAEAGAAFITTPRFASQRMDSCSPKGESPPPHDPETPFWSKNIPYTEIIDPGDPPIRPERHVPNSITSIRIAIARAIARAVHRCPCCQSITRRIHL